MVGINNTTKGTEVKKVNKEEKVMKTKLTKKTEVKKEVKKAPETKKQEVKKPETKTVKKEVKKENAKKANVLQMTNSQLAKLFTDNGCVAKAKAKDASKVVYNTFGTESRILQQGKAYQLLLTNGHEMKKGVVVDGGADDVERFTKWYKGLTKEQQGYINGFDTITATKLATSEMPRERTVKVTNYELLVEYIKYMATFEENRIAK